MRILLTGASSFTGFWFARALAASGHQVVAPLRGVAGSYQTGMRARRVALLAECAEPVWDCAFGSDRFLTLVDAGPWDLLCHHAADVTNYRSPDFDVAAALAANTRALPVVLRRLKDQGLRAMVLTGSVFEANEGAGSAPMRAFSPYGVSKGLTAALVEYWCGELAVKLAKFTIANPFGPFEEPRFTAFLVKSWQKGEVPDVRTPLYVRDNIHVDLLAACYARLCQMLGDGADVARLNPSQYAESQGAFTRRFATEFAARSGLDCPVGFGDQRVFEEPAVRINTNPATLLVPEWDESIAWDKMVHFYTKL